MMRTVSEFEELNKAVRAPNDASRSMAVRALNDASRSMAVRALNDVNGCTARSSHAAADGRVALASLVKLRTRRIDLSLIHI